MQAAEYIITILADPQSSTVLSLEYVDEMKKFLLKLALIFDQKENNNKKLPIKNKKYHISKTKFVPLPPTPVTPLSPILTNSPKKT